MIDLPLTEIALTIPRVACGVFFAISGGHKLIVPERHAALVQTLKADKVPAVGLMQWWVPGWELVAGLALVAGFFTVPAAAVLATIMVVACICEAREKVAAYKPINVLDKVDDYLYLPEVLLLLMLVSVMLAGPGALSVDALVFG